MSCSKPTDPARPRSESSPLVPFLALSCLFAQLGNSSVKRQATILNAISHWLENVQLIDPECEICADENPPFERGFGDAEVTHFVLNNLTYITAEWFVRHKELVPKLWINLVHRYPTNLPIIVQHLFVTMSLSPELMIPVAKKIAICLLDACGERVVTLLAQQLSLMTEQFKFSLVRHHEAPFYKWQQNNVEQDLPDAENEEQTEKNAGEQSQEQLEPAEDGPKPFTQPVRGLFYHNEMQHFLQPNQPVANFTKSNLALFLLSDLIGADENIVVNWTNYLTTVVHVSLLYLDATRPMVCRHARMSLINMCVYFAPQNTNQSSVLLNNALQMQKAEVMDGTNDANGSLNTQIGSDHFFASECHLQFRQMLLGSKATFNSDDELLQALVFCLSEKMDKSLWTEDVSARGWKLETTDQLSCFVHHLCRYFERSVPKLPLKWTDLAMQLALSINHKHFASRSFQIASALCQNPTPWIGRILSRLAELVGDHNEDTQYYIMYMMLSLQALVPYVKSVEGINKSVLQSPSSPTDHNLSISGTPAFLSNQNQTCDDLERCKTPPLTVGRHFNRSSYKKDARHSMLLENEVHSTMVTSTPLNRSKSAATLKVDTLSNEESIMALAQLMAISVIMLESHIDNEYLLALNLMDRILESVGPDRDHVLQRLEKIVKRLEWRGFAGVVRLACRGTTYTSGHEVAVSVLTKCIPISDEPIIISPNSFALIVISILPYMLSGFDNMTPLCVKAALAISVYCQDQLPQGMEGYRELTCRNHPLGCLSTMMLEYHHRGPRRERFEWSENVIFYLLGSLRPSCVQLILLLAEMLEKCPHSMQEYLVHIVRMIVSHGDLTVPSTVPMYAHPKRSKAYANQQLKQLNSNFQDTSGSSVE